MENRIKEIRTARKMSQQRLASLTETTPQQIGHLERAERKLTQNWMERLSSALGVLPADLLPRLEKAEEDSTLDASSLPPREEAKIVEIASYHSSVCAGSGHDVEAKQSPDAYSPFPVEWLNEITQTHCKSLAFVRVEGDSMHPTLRSGDRVLMDTTSRGGREGIFVLTIDSDTYVKRLRFTGGLLHIMSDNPRYKDYSLDLTDGNIIVHGRVIWAGSKFLN